MLFLHARLQISRKLPKVRKGQLSCTHGRRISAMSTTTKTSPFTLAAVNAMRKLYPESLADKSFDNTGLLLESPVNVHREKPLRNSVLLTIDLTQAVATEAIEKDVSLIVAYHPIIFRGLKSITSADTQQQSLLRLAAEGISVYCPHTAVDAVDGGNADWLADIVTGSNVFHTGLQSQPSNFSEGSQTVTFTGQTYKLQNWPSYQGDRLARGLELGIKDHRRSPIVKTTDPPETYEDSGMGRLVHLAKSNSLNVILNHLLSTLGEPPAIKLALPSGAKSLESIQIQSFAVCCGSGGSVFSKLTEPVDLLITGEMSHHEVLAATERGQSVICLGHSNSERGYLWAVMQASVERVVQHEWETEQLDNVSDEVQVEVSKMDKDPFGTLIRE